MQLQWRTFKEEGISVKRLGCSAAAVEDIQGGRDISKEARLQWRTFKEEGYQ